MDRVAKKCGDDLTGEDVSELKYLDQVFSETLRLGPFAFTNRMCTKDWALPGHPGVVIPKGMRVRFSIAGPMVRLHWCDSCQSWTQNNELMSGSSKDVVQ